MNNGPVHNAEGRAIHLRNMVVAQHNNRLPEEAVVNAMNPAANRASEDAFRAAVIAGNVEEINRIAEEGRIDPNAALDEQDHPALWIAVHAAQQDAIRALVENGAQLDITTNNSDGIQGPLLALKYAFNRIIQIFQSSTVVDLHTCLVLKPIDIPIG